MTFGTLAGLLAVVFTGANTEVVVAKRAPKTVRFAAQEATNFLSRTFGRAIPVVNAPTAGKASLVLGENEWSKAAGIDLEGRKRDTFVIRTLGDAVYVAGRDSGRADPMKTPNLESFERATLFGVYEFLERFAGCRFYFPGELGEVAPRKDEIRVDAADIVSTPCCPVRKYYNHPADGAVSEGLPADAKRIHWLRTRGATMQIPCCHGSIRFKLLEKFKDTHPEYFALRSDGSRCTNYTGAPSSRNGHLCFSSGVRDAIVEECVKRFKDGAEFVDIMPNDAYPECKCEVCQKTYRLSDKQNYASEVIWGYTVYVANKLKERGIKGNITQMAYCPYRRIPDFDIPDNVYVMVAEGGPWSVVKPESMAAQYEEIRAWKRKLANPVWIWTYPHKYGPTLIKGVPDVAPRAWAKYFKGIAADTLGTFAESETDRWIYHYLNYYVFGKVMWDPTVDTDAILDEHYRLMFGAAASEMKGFYEALEDKWLHRIVGNVVDTNLGPVATPPTEHDLWVDVYGAEAIARLGGFLDRAAAKVAPDSIEAKRIAFFRREYFDGLSVGSAEYGEKLRAVEALTWNAAAGEKVTLIPFNRKGKEQEEPVRTDVTAKRTADALVFTFDCEEPRMDDVTVTKRDHDHEDMWRDSGVELFLNVSGDRKTYLHFIVNAEGCVTDYRCIKAGGGYAKSDKGWESGATTRIDRRADGYTATVSIPLKALGDVPARFPIEVCRSRITKSGKGYGLYRWSPYAKDWDEVRAFGTIILGDR